MGWKIWGEPGKNQIPVVVKKIIFLLRDVEEIQRTFLNVDHCEI